MVSPNVLNLVMNGLAGWTVTIQQKVVTMKPLVITVWRKLAPIHFQSMPALVLLGPLLSLTLTWLMDSGAITMINPMVKTALILKSDFAVLKRSAYFIRYFDRFIDRYFQAEHTCDREGYKWTVWLDRDDPTGDVFGTGDTGDWENRDGFPANIVCQTPIGIQAQVRSGSDGSTEVTHFDNEQGTLNFYINYFS